MAVLYQHNCFLCIRTIKTNSNSFIKKVPIFERKYLSTISKQGTVTKSELVNPECPNFVKSMMFRRLSTKEVSNLLHPCAKNINIEQRYCTLNHSRQLNESYKSKKLYPASAFMWSNKNMITRFLNLTSAYTSVLPTNRKKLNLPHTYKLNLDFTSSATTNIERSDSSRTSNIFKKLYRKVIPEPLSVSKSTLYKTGAILSSCCTHEVELESFFKAFDMPDTFYSWWLVTELHAWMLCVRLNVGNTKEGLHCRNSMVTQIYTDMDDRAKKVADMDRKGRQNVIWDLAEEFKFAMLIYDLGLAGSDVDLANSIWRRFFLGKDDPDVEKIELLVKYVRKTVASLDQIKLDELYLMEMETALNWPSLTKLEKNKN